MPDPIAVAAVEALKRRGQTLATAESLTGGLISATLTGVPGASEVFVGGVVTYATDLKRRLAGVPDEVLRTAGVISPQTATAMATGALAATAADWAVAVTGVAGPDSQDGHRPGEVWVGLAGPGREPAARRLDLAGDRESVRLQTVREALGWLVETLSQTPSSAG